jgi:hypothetical protein
MSNQISSKSVLKGLFATDEIMTASNFDDFISSVVTVGSDTVVTITSNADYTLEVDDASGKGPCKTYVYNGYGNITINLPSVTSSNIGLWYNFINLTRFKMSIQAADNDTIDDSDPGATIYNGTDFDELSSEDSESSESSNSEQEVEKFASIKVQLCTGTWWHVMHGRKTWTTTKFV